MEPKRKYLTFEQETDLSTISLEDILTLLSELETQVSDFDSLVTYLEILRHLRSAVTALYRLSTPILEESKNRGDLWRKVRVLPSLDERLEDLNPPLTRISEIGGDSLESHLV